MLLKNCSYIVTQDTYRTILRNKDISIQGNRIFSIGDDLADPGPVIDCSHKIVMPGLINTHTHLGMHSLKGICDDETLFRWLEIVNAEEDKLSMEEVLMNTREGVIESIRSGTTTVYDSYKFGRERVKVFLDMGVRAFVSSTVQVKEDIRHVERLLDTCNGTGLVRPIVAGHSPYRCKKEVLELIRDISRKYNLIRRIHIAETKKEMEDTIAETGMSSIRYLDSFGFLGPRALLVHSIWIDDEEVDIIAKRGASVSHNPISNMKLAAGNVAPVVKMLERGIHVGLGTDSVASNNDLDMFEELKVTALIHKHHNCDPKAMTFQKVVDMATLHGAKCLGLTDVGSIEEGRIADIITLDLRGMTPIRNVVSNIVYCANGNNVCESIIDGRLIMRDKRILSME